MRCRLTLLIVVLAVVFVASSTFALDTYQGKVFDFGGDTVVIQGSSNAPQMAGIGRAPHDAFEEWENDPAARAHKAAVEELFNVNIVIEPRPSDASATWIADIMAGDPYADIMGRSTSDYKNVELAGALLPLDQFIDDEFLERANPYWKAHRYEVFGHGGDTYSVYVGTRGYLPFAFVWWNRDLFERAGYHRDYLWELWEAGEWTWEVYMDLAEELTQDTTGDGQLDQFGYMRPRTTQMIYSNIKDYVVRQDGMVRPAFDQPEWLDMLEVIAEWRDREVPAANDFVPSGLHRRQLFVDGQVAMYIDHDHVITWYPAILDMDDDYALAPLPMGPSGVHQSYYAGANHHFFPITTDRGEELLALQQALYRGHRDWEQDMNDHVNYRAGQFRDRKTVEVLFDGLANPDYPVHYWFGMPDPLSDVWDGMDPRAAVDSVMPEAQAWLDEVLGQ